MKRKLRYLVLWIVNSFLSGNHFWKLKRFLLVACGIVVGNNTKIVGPIKIGTCADLIIGDNCWIGEHCVIYGNAKVSIGDNCDLAPNVSFATGTHEIGTHARRAGKGYCESISVGNGCWIGINSTILSGVNIADGCCIGACALVKHSFSEDSLVGGVPAKVIKRFK